MISPGQLIGFMAASLVMIVIPGPGVSDCGYGYAASAVRNWFASSPRRFELVGGAGGLAMIGVGVTVAITGRKSLGRDHIIVDIYGPHRGLGDPRSPALASRLARRAATSPGAVVVSSIRSAACAGEVPSTRTPRSASTAISTAAQVIDASARLNVHGKCGRLIQSTTRPRSRPGARNNRSPRLPMAPPSSSPSAIVQARLRSRRAVRMI